MRYTIQDFREDFPTEDSCLERLWEIKSCRLKVCPQCNENMSYSKVKGRKCYQCSSCQNQIYPMAGTIFQGSPVPLEQWFYAIYLFSLSKNGVTAKSLERKLGVTYPTAWSMGHKIRALMVDDEIQLSGVVEVDDAWIGGKVSNMARPKRFNFRNNRRFDVHYTNKIPVIGMVERGGKVIVKAVGRVNGYFTRKTLVRYVDNNSTVIVDDAKVYKQFGTYFKRFLQINKRDQTRKQPGIHTNTIEGFWSGVKRMIRGNYVQVSNKHLQSYLDEAAFRYNYRKSTTPLIYLLLFRASKPSAKNH